MLEDSFRAIRALLSSTRSEELHKGLELAGIEIIQVGSREAKPLAVKSLFIEDSALVSQTMLELNRLLQSGYYNSVIYAQTHFSLYQALKRGSLYNWL